MTDKYVEAAVAAALRKAAEVSSERLNGSDDWLVNAILALPHDESHLREFSKRVANAVWDDVVRLEQRPNELEDIVDRALKGEQSCKK